MEPVRVLVTGAAGQIAYSLILQIGKGDVFGEKQPVILHLLDIPPMMTVLQGVVMEIEDCALPLVKDVVATSDVDAAFKNIDAAFLVGSMPRKEGMERKDLLKCNVNIFKTQGQALDQFAKKSVKVLVVGNPANTNAYICAKYAPSIPRENFSAMTRLDQNRAKAAIAKRVGVTADKVKNAIIWGNHSSTQFPDVKNATVELPVGEVPVYDAIKDDNWLQNEFVKTIQVRGAAVISARKMSSAMSAAKAAADHMKDIWFGTNPGESVSMGVISDGSYGIAKDVVFSFPVQIVNKSWKIAENFKIDDFARSKLSITEKELLEEKEDALQVCKD